MSEINQKPGGMDIETTFECSRCGKELPVTNQLTHEVACARMHRENQRAQPNVRQSSSGAIPEGVIQQREQPIPRREERQTAENKLIACPNCQKSVLEQDINSHMDNECMKSEMIPCEFCDKAIPMSNYSQHIDGCPKRAENRRDQAPIRERREAGGPSQQQQRQGPTGRDRSPRRGSSLGGGGVPGLLMNLAGLNSENQQQQQQYPQYQSQQQFQQFQQFPPQGQQQQQGGFFSNIFGQPVPRNLENDPNSQGQRVFRTVEYGPDGSVVVRSQIVPTNNNNNQFQMYQQTQMSHPMEFNPLGMLFNMMSGRGLIPMGNGEFELGPTEEGRGLDKGTINSLAVIKYNKEANKNVSEDLKKCPICLDDFQDGQEVRFLWCTHRFHKGCVDQWLDKHTTCPICKKDFSEAEYGFSP